MTSFENPSDKIQRDSSSSTQNRDILPSISSHFESEDDSTSYTKKEMDHIFFNLFGLDREEEEDSSFARILTRKWSKDGIDAMVLLPWKEIREMQD